MKTTFNSEKDALAYRERHHLFGRVPEQLAGSGRWALNFPLKAHVTVAPHTSPTQKFG